MHTSLGVPNRLFEELYGRDSRLDIEGISGGFFAVQDVAPLGIDGAHILLLPKTHDGGHDISFALTQDQDGLRTATMAILEKLFALFPNNPILYFEHGPGFVDGEPIACGGCHMDHAHGHIVVLPEDASFDPIRLNTEASLAQSGWGRTLSAQTFRTREIFDGTEEITGSYPYVRMGFIDTDRNFIALTYVQHTKSEQVESQLLRRVLAEVVYQKRDATSGFTTPERLQEMKDGVRILRERLASL